MDSRNISKKIVASVLILAFILPFIFTGIYSEASATKSSLQQNMQTYNFSADTNNMTIKITKSITRYRNAADANNRANGLESYTAGTYYIYKSVNGALNISKAKNAPGSWVNARDLEGKTFINSSTNKETTKNSNATTIKLNVNSKVYVSADDATKKINSKATYSAGTYYIYKTTSTAVNITKTNGQPGAWIPKAVLTNVEENPIKTPAPKPITKTPTNDTSSSEKIVINNKVNIYMTAADALNGTNSRGIWPSGTYQIYKSYGKAINITTTAGQPGSWIDGSKLTSTPKVDNTKPNTTPKVDNTKPNTTPKVDNTKPNNNTTPLYNINDTVIINDSIKVYGNADDAINENNSVSTFSKGTYFIYKVYGKTINITGTKGQPGGWIVAEIKQAPVSEVKNDSNAITTGKPFVLVLDPGHGGGIAHNRGGVLFNEGDKNYDFTQNIIKEASKYSNFIVKSTRVNNSDDPSFEDRSKLGNDADLFVSIHTNAAKADVRGVEAWGSQKNSTVGHDFAKDITQIWSQVMSTPNRGVMYDYKDANQNPRVASSPDAAKEDTWFVFKGNTAKEKVLLESVFHTNIEDSKAFLKNQELLAQEFIKSIARNFGLILN